MYDILNRTMMIIRILLVHLIVVILKANNHRRTIPQIPNRIVIIKIIQDMKEILINMIDEIIEKKPILRNPIHNIRKQNLLFDCFYYF
jgi:hypothetical protein